VQKRLIASVLGADRVIRIPWFVRLLFRTPVLRDIPARMLGFGIRPAHVQR
jgi:hypothetical protein